MDLIEKAIGRKLTESERRTVEWLDGWDRETRMNVLNLIHDAYEAGLKIQIKNK